MDQSSIVSGCTIVIVLACFILRVWVLVMAIIDAKKGNYAQAAMFVALACLLAIGNLECLPPRYLKPLILNCIEESKGETTMGRQIIKQPNGKYAVWSSIVDDFILVDATPDEIIEDWCEQQRKDTTEHVQRVVEELGLGVKPYHQLTHTFDECIHVIRERHGDDAESLQLLGVGRKP